MIIMIMIIMFINHQVGGQTNDDHDRHSKSVKISTNAFFVKKNSTKNA